MGSAMSNEISVQNAEHTYGANGTQKQNFVQKGKSCLSTTHFDLLDINIEDLPSLKKLDAATAIHLAASFPEHRRKIYIQYLLQRGVQPFADTPFKSAGMIEFLTDRWNFKATPEMELLQTIGKLSDLTKAPTRLASLAHFENLPEIVITVEKFEGSDSEAELEDKVIEATENASESAEPAKGKKEITKAWGKGVGYGSEYTGDLADWDPAQWKNDSDSKEEELVKVLNDISEKISEESTFDVISESSLIPTLIRYLQNDSFHDITSKHKIYTAVFTCIVEMMKNPKYLPLFFENHGTNVAQCVCNLGRAAEKVVKMGELVDDATEDDSTRCANVIVEAYRAFLKALDDLTTALRVSQILTKDTTNLDPLLSKLQDLRESFDESGSESTIDLRKKQDATHQDYEAIMREFCFGGVEEFSEFGPHKYSSNDVRVKRKLMKRLAGEFADFSSSLPIHHESSVFFRMCDEKMSHAQMLIIPADGTPYAAGCFIFDIMFPANYPNSPPKVNLATTGHGAVRFNPNLYNCGKVCLSLLGTWDAYSQGEKWSPEVSTFLQVAISIQSLIFVAEPFYNEPGDEDSMGTEWGDQQSRAYNVVIQSGTTKYAMIEMLQNPPAAWKDVIDTHFTLQGDRALKNVTDWLGAEHNDTKRLAELLNNLRSKQIESSSEDLVSQRNIGA
jgi:ubiquitin-protein ligase